MAQVAEILSVRFISKFVSKRPFSDCKILLLIESPKPTRQNPQKVPDPLFSITVDKIW